MTESMSFGIVGHCQSQEAPNSTLKGHSYSASQNPFVNILRLKKLEAHESAKDPRAQGIGFKAKATVFWTPSAFLLKNA